jgi:SIR2-like domain
VWVDGPADARLEGQPPWFPAEAEPLLQPPEKVIPVIGAGMSLAAGLEDARALARWIGQLPMANGVELPAYQRENLFAVADAVVGGEFDRAIELRRLVADRLRLREGQFRITEALAAVVHAPSRLIMTFNYDELIEAAAANEGLPYRSGTQEDIELLQEITDGQIPLELTILHLHGWVRAPLTIVLDWDGYRRQIHNGLMKVRFFGLAQAKNFLFLGMSMNEPYLLTWLQELAQWPPRHIYVCDEAVDAHSPILKRRHGTIPAVFPAGAYEELDAIVTTIFGRMP